MQRGERIRLQLCFGLFAGLAVALCLRLTWLQGFDVQSGRESVARQRERFERIPLPRGGIMDRNGQTLAYDRAVFEVRAEAYAKVPRGTLRIPTSFAEQMASRLTAHLMLDVRRKPADRSRLRALLKERILRRKIKNAPGGRYLMVDFLVARDLDSYNVLKRLEAEQKAWNKRGSKLPGRLYLHFSRQYVRTYPHQLVMAGPVGVHQRQAVLNRNGEPQRDFEGRVLVREVATGMESYSGLWPGSMLPEGVQPTWYPRQGQGYLRGQFIVPGRGRFWTGREVTPPPPSAVTSTLDLRLQRAAQEELRLAAAAVQEHYESPMGWGALVLVSIQSGDVLAMASHYPSKDGKPRKGTAFAPLQNLYEPGSVVKPLLVALALERKAVHWHQEIDCTPTLPGNGWRVPAERGRRVIRDDHRCGKLTPHTILVNSSNIGAVQVGLRLGRKGLRAYLDRYRFGHRTGFGIPGERRGGATMDPMKVRSESSFRCYTGASLSFGYEMNVTAVQLARAYLTLLSGRSRELRLVRRVQVDGEAFDAPPAPQSERFLSTQTVDLVRQAMVDVVSDTPGATGSRIYKMLQELGYEGSVLGGKTGTSVSSIGRPRVKKKTASFVGFAPAVNPQFLVVCVLRKDRANKFYGGRFAAPSAARLLLTALEQFQGDAGGQLSGGYGSGDRKGG